MANFAPQNLYPFYPLSLTGEIERDREREEEKELKLSKGITPKSFFILHTSSQ